MPKSKRTFQRLRLAVLMVCVFASLILSAGLVVSGAREYAAVEPRVLQNSAALSRILAEHFGNLFRAVDARFDALADWPRAPLSGKTPREEPGVVYWFVLDPQGRVVEASDPAVPRGRMLPLPPKDQIIVGARATGFFIGAPESSLGTPTRFIPILRPILDRQGHLRHYLGAALDGDYFTNFFKDLEAWGANGIVIVADSGPIILRYPYLPEAIGRDYRGQTVLWDQAEAHGTGWFYEKSPFDGVEKMIHYRRVNDVPVVVMVNRAKSEIFGPWMVATWVRIGTLLFGIAVVVILGRVLWKQIARLEQDQENLRLYRAYALRSQRFESIGRFAGGIAHDFNNILTILFGHLDRLGQVLPPLQQPNQQQFMETALKARDLVRRILAFSRPRMTGIRAVSVDAWIEEARPLLHAAVPSRVDLSLRVQPGLHLYGDGDHLTQVVMHLVSNATEALEKSGGSLEISIETSPSESRPEVRLRVKDNGVGIAQEKLGQVFSPFYSTKASEGAGLGLALTKALVEAAGGRIQISSQQGVGTSVEVYWPQARPHLTSVVAQPPPGTVSGGAEVLFVDDESAVVELIQDALGGEGIQVEAWTDPLAALASFRSTPGRFALLVTDINMRQMTGFELTDEVLGLNPALRVIFTTAHPEYEIEAEKRAALAPERLELLRKPYHLEQLIQRIRRQLSAAAGRSREVPLR